MRKEINIELLYSLFLTSLIGVVGWNTGLFWDNILFVHKMSVPLIEHGIWNWGCIPLESDPGHPPFIATYMSLVWSIFERSIPIAHIALYPFVFLFIFEVLAIANFIFKNRTLSLITISLVLADPTIFASLMYVGTEVFILSFSAIAVRGILTNNIWRKIIGLMFLGLCCLRGMMLCAGLFLWDAITMLVVKRNSIKSICSWQNLHPYLIASIPAVTFIVWRLINKGWIISNPLASWGNATEFNGINDFLFNFVRNIAVFIQRITDFGRIIIVGVVFILLWVNRNKIKISRQLLTILLFITLSCSIIVIASLLIRNPMGHSYFMLIYIGLSFLVVELMRQIKWNKIIYIIVFSALVLGNLIVYPNHISQGWSASLASLPYWQLRKELLLYIDKQEIPLETVFFDFPFGKCADDIDLNGDKRLYAKNIEHASYFVASNVCNFSDEILMQIRNYSPIFHVQNRGIYITLYKIP